MTIREQLAAKPVIHSNNLNNTQNPTVMKKNVFLFAAMAAIVFTSCEKDRGLNLFSVEQDMAFGDSLSYTIAKSPTEYPVLSRTANPQAYAYVDNMMDLILQSDKFKYGSKFDWEVTIINADVMNAFAAPGGKLYFYTGLIKYLDDAASFAGVMGHEMAHADLRHSTQVMTKQYGFELLLTILMGENQTAMEQLAANMALGLGGLKFSRDNEYDADRYSMYYLATTKYEPLGISSFFEKMLKEGKTSDNFTWLSTHPSDQQRVDKVKDVYANDSDLKSLMKGRTYDRGQAEFEAFQALLP